MPLIFVCQNCLGYYCQATMNIDDRSNDEYPVSDDLQCLRRVSNVHPVWRQLGEVE